MNRIIILGLFILITFFVSCKSAPKNNSNDHTKNADSSLSAKDLYTNHCIACHGADGTMGMSGAKNLQNSELTSEAIIKQITRGKGMMVGFEDKLSADEIEQLSTYVISLRK